MKEKDVKKSYEKVELCYQDYVSLIFTMSMAYDGITYQLQYEDYENEQWTTPILLLPRRAKKLTTDLSIKKIKLQRSDGRILELSII